MTKWFYQKSKNSPYTHLAAIYDEMMNHVDYVKWSDYVVTLFQKFGSGIRRVIDGGCGTGSLLQALNNREIWIAGFDQSIEMIRIAKKKVQIPLWVDDLRTFSFRKKWDAFLCLYDTIQYLTIDEIRELFDHVGKILTPGGLFIFDAVTRMHVLKYWIDYTERIGSNGLEVFRRSWYVTQSQSQHTEFEIFDNHHKSIHYEHHIQHVYSMDTYMKMSGENGLKLVGQFQNFTLNPGNEKSDRIHFVFKRE